MKTPIFIFITFIYIGDSKQTTDVKLFLKRSYDSYDTTELTRHNINMVNTSKPIKIIVHGWMSSSQNDEIVQISSTYLARYPQNVILVDWSVFADQSYFEATTNIPIAANKVVEIIKSLHDSDAKAIEKIHIVAHSLGAHLAGHIGREVFRSTGVKIPRITALDPSGPLFEEGSSFVEQDAVKPLLLLDFASIDFNNVVSELKNFKLPALEMVAKAIDMYRADPLTKDDATVVHVIHTDACELGIAKPIGTIDFYPNGGTPIQPGCAACPSEPKWRHLLELEKIMHCLTCSHFKSVEYFLNSINDVIYVGYSCESWDKYKSGMCDTTTTALMGDPSMGTHNVSGTFFLYT